MATTLFTDLDPLTPATGDLIVAQVLMRAWETESARGTDGEHIEAGEQALVLRTWNVGNQRRMKVIRDDRVMVFSCAGHVVRKNWKIAQQASGLPTIGGP